jgi:hypothetical protein
MSKLDKGLLFDISVGVFSKILHALFDYDEPGVRDLPDMDNCYLY